MNRELMFRYSYQDSKGNGKVSYGIDLEKLASGNKHPDLVFEEITECDCQPVGETNVVECNCEDQWKDYIHIATNQFTGMKDAGKSEIYEGDIIENDSIQYTVVWDDDGMWSAIDSEGNNIALYELASSRDTWLQGNIYENPELLTP